MSNEFYRNGRFLTGGDATGHRIIGLPNGVDLRRKVTTPVVTANSAEKRHSRKKKIVPYEQADRLKEADVGQTNIAQSTHASDKCSTLVSTL